VKFSLFDTLVRHHPDGTLDPALATDWRRTAATTWQLTLRPGVGWHDGTRFTSVDAKYSLDRTYDATLKAARLSPFFQTIDRTEAPSPETLVIHTNRPVGLWTGVRNPCGAHADEVQPTTLGLGALPALARDMNSPAAEIARPRVPVTAA